MKWELLLVSLILIVPVSAITSTTVYDDFSPGVNCVGDALSCGSGTDAIVHLTGTFTANLTDDGLATYVCVLYDPPVGSTSIWSCIIRQGFNTTICDPIIATTTSNYNKTFWYTCPSTNLTTCGWNGENGIPLLGENAPTDAWVFDTAVVNSSRLTFINFLCNVSPQVSASPVAVELHSFNTKGVICQGNDYASVIYDENSQGVSLGGPLSCSRGSFCDPALNANYSTSSTLNGTYCTPGCHDGAQNGGETDVDYGGFVCGNCSPDGRNSDAFYGFAVEMQESNLEDLSNSYPFNATEYCPLGEQVAGVSFAYLIVILLVSGIFIMVLSTIAGLGIFTIIVTVGKFINRKRRKDG